ncbi:hypothetical protein [Micromonospora sp. DT31]|uniref:hypothetical protein n=1 Tax=Micromonospora sp. DT31 TaxID=3393434 RepID=UPI003CEC0006
MSRRLRPVAAVALVLALIGLTPSAATAAPTPATEQLTVRIDADTAFVFILCLKTSTTVNPATRPPGKNDRQCSGRKPASEFDMTVTFTPGDTVWMDVEMIVGAGSVTKDNIDITGSTKCWFTGVVHAGKFRCDSGVNKKSFTPPSFEPYSIDVEDPETPVMQLLNLMAWCVSAAAVAGLLLTGMTLASQMRRGALEERTEYVRQIALVFAACLIATTAGPIVEALGFSQ